jgi:hypothetical protein
VTVESLTNVKLAAVPLNFTEFTPVKFVPWMVTVVPTLPLAGLKLVIAGVLPPLVTMKLLPLCALPSDVVTMIGPVDAPLGTLTVTLCPDALTVNPGAFVPLNVTEVVPAKFVPWMATLVPIGPLPGSKLEMVGEVPAAAGNAVIERTSATITPDTPMLHARVAAGVRFILTLPDRWVRSLVLLYYRRPRRSKVAPAWEAMSALKAARWRSRVG